MMMHVVLTLIGVLIMSSLRFFSIQTWFKKLISNSKNILDLLKLHVFSDDHNKPTKSGEFIGYNDDLLIEILRRVPTNSILRFKSLSKHWHSLLSDLYSKLRLSSPGLFYGDYYVPFNVNNNNNNNPPFDNQAFYLESRGIKILQSCNGLLLCCSTKIEIYCMFNPTTKQFEEIPLVKDFWSPYNFMGLAVHPANYRYYKLVCISQNRDCSRFSVQIYSSNNKRWKILNETLATPNHVPYLSCGVYMNGGIYWSPFNNHIDSWYYFKLGVNKFQKLELPSSMKTTCSRPHGCGMVTSVCYFGESRGRLLLSDLVSLNGCLRLTVYEMMSYNSRWVVMYQVEFDQFMAQLVNGLRCNRFDKLKVLDIVRGEKEEDTFMVVKYLNEIKSFNLFDKSFKILSIVPDVYNEKTMKSHRYFATLGLI